MGKWEEIWESCDCDDRTGTGAAGGIGAAGRDVGSKVWTAFISSSSAKYIRVEASCWYVSDSWLQSMSSWRSRKVSTASRRLFKNVVGSGDGTKKPRKENVWAEWCMVVEGPHRSANCQGWAVNSMIASQSRHQCKSKLQCTKQYMVVSRPCQRCPEWCPVVPAGGPGNTSQPVAPEKGAKGNESNKPMQIWQKPRCQ